MTCNQTLACALDELSIGTHVFKEDLEDTTGLLVDKTRDTLDTATTGKTTNSRLCYTWVRVLDEDETRIEG
jgi:hypothetical protein